MTSAKLNIDVLWSFLHYLDFTTFFLRNNLNLIDREKTKFRNMYVTRSYDSKELKLILFDLVVTLMFIKLRACPTKL